MESDSHRQEVVSQFTRQSRLFADHRAHSENRSLEVFRELGDFTGRERVLDSGCGPGLVSCHLAPWVGEVVGADLTPAMLELGRSRAAERGLSNVTFVHGDMTSLPFAAGEFDVAITRYAFHHLQNPRAAFAELVRVTKPGGRIMVLDATPEESKREAYDAFERQRDSSHTSALTAPELTSLGEADRLIAPEVRHFGLEMSAESLVASSFPEGDDRQQLLDLLTADVETDHLSFQVRQEEAGMVITFPLTAAMWRR